MKGCSTSLVIKEMQINTTMKYHYTLINMPIKNKTGNIKYWWEFETTDAHIFLVGIQNDTAALNDGLIYSCHFPTLYLSRAHWIMWAYRCLFYSLGYHTILSFISPFKFQFWLWELIQVGSCALSTCPSLLILFLIPSFSAGTTGINHLSKENRNPRSGHWHVHHH